MLLISCEFILIITCTADCIISSATWASKFAITDTNIFVPIVTLSTKSNEKLLRQFKLDFKKTIS